MISNSRQNWIVGHSVKVGFMTLNVRAALKSLGDYRPNAYILSNLRGDKLYKFVPHNGCQSITIDEAKELMAEQDEIDSNAGVLFSSTIHLDRTGLRVPLSDAALDMLRQAAKLTVRPDAASFVFPGVKAGKPLSSMALLMLLRRMGRADLTAHGFRSTFRDWCAESTNYPQEIAEAALAHTLRDKTEPPISAAI